MFNNQCFIFFVFWGLAFIGSAQSHAQIKTVYINLNDSTSCYIKSELALLTDQNIKNEALLETFNTDFRNVTEAKPDNDRYAWYSLVVINKSGKPKNSLYINPDFHDMTRCYLYKFDQEKQRLSRYVAFWSDQEEETEPDFMSSLLRVELNSDTTRLFLVKQICKNCYKKGIFINSEPQTIKSVLNLMKFDSLLWGIMLGLLIYNIVLYLLIRDKVYFYYVLSLTGMLLNFTYLDIIYAVGSKYLTFFNLKITQLFVVNIGVMAFLRFSQYFLSTQTRSIQWHKWFNFLQISLFVSMLGINISVYIGQDHTFNVNMMYNGLVLIMLVSILVYSFQQYRQNYLPAQYFLFANAIGISLCLVNLAYLLQIIPSSFFARNALKIGTVLQILGFSLALAGRINFLRQEISLKKAENTALERQRIEEVQRLTEEKNKELEHKVVVRTSELSQTLEKLNQSHEELQTTLETVQIQSETIAKKNEDITASINYAKRIQNAMLPQMRVFEELFGMNNYFVIYKPRDIVSGDFYWLSANEHYTILVAADCTGHGVPGAFMSMIGINLLEDIVNVRQVSAPAQILTELDKDVRYALKQQETSTNDGMDTAVIAIAKDKTHLFFAGAMNSLYYLFTHSEATQKIKGSKKMIGGIQDTTTAKLSFEEHKIDITNTHVTLYLASDGFQDQFGSHQNKKITSRRLRELLFEHKALRMDEQKQVLSSYFENWKGNYPQIDDVMLLGIRL